MLTWRRAHRKVPGGILHALGPLRGGQGCKAQPTDRGEGVGQGAGHRVGACLARGEGAVEVGHSLYRPLAGTCLHCWVCSAPRSNGFDWVRQWLAVGSSQQGAHADGHWHCQSASVGDSSGRLIILPLSLQVRPYTSSSMQRIGKSRTHQQAGLQHQQRGQVACRRGQGQGAGSGSRVGGGPERGPQSSSGRLLNPTSV